MRKALLILAAAAFATPATAEFVVNGGFEAGNTGFASTYDFVQALNVAGAGNNMVPENTYTIGTNAFNQHPSWINMTAREGTNYLIANGRTQNSDFVWQQTLTGLTPGATYQFSAFAANICCNASYGGTNVSPFIVSVGSGGTPSTIATTGSLAAQGAWTPFFGNFVQGAGTTNILSIRTNSTAASGNDFGLDQISVQAVPEPATWGMMLAGFGFVGSMMRRKSAARLRFV